MFSKNGVIKEARLPISQFLWEGKNLTSLGACLQEAKLSPIIKYQKFAFPSDNIN